MKLLELAKKEYVNLDTEKTRWNRLHLFVLCVLLFCISGCTTIYEISRYKTSYLETPELTDNIKQFVLPASDKTGIYIYRNTAFFGAGIKRDVWLNNQCVGETKAHIFYYREIPEGQEIIITTESEFSPNELKLVFQGGQHYFIEQYVKPGVFRGGTNLKVVDPEEAKKIIVDLPLGVGNDCRNPTP
jgi:hypothetical protein